MKRIIASMSLMCAVVLVGPAAARAEFTLLHSFAFDSATNGALPEGGTLLQSGSTLYGMTEDGGANNRGTIFQIGDDGTGFGLLHSFAGGDGALPRGSLIQAGSTL
jgi:uncharacterized repeat protein (TIGR03803 family)